MKQYYLIQNAGEIDVNALRLLGASTKDETQIGYFGTGLKYAVASALRLGVKLKVFSGETEIKITARKTKLREVEFQEIYVNGKSTGLTTQLGKDWQPWYILRELYCNALDEPEAMTQFTSDEFIQGKIGYTRIYLEMTEVMNEIANNQNRYFTANREAVLEWPFGIKAQLFHPIENRKLKVYRKGILVYERDSRTSLYDYNFDVLSINEARESTSWEIERATIKLWKFDATEDMVLRLINGPGDSYEYNLDWELYAERPMSNGWLVLQDRIIIPKEHSGYYGDDTGNLHVFLPHKLCIELNKYFPTQLRIRGVQSKDPGVIREYTTSARQELFIQEAFKFLKMHSAFEDIDRYPVIVADLEQGVLGMATEEKIYLSTEIFLHGKRGVVSTLLEEYVHLRCKTYDKTRGMQEVLKDFLITAIEDRTQVYL